MTAGRCRYLVSGDILSELSHLELASEAQEMIISTLETHRDQSLENNLGQSDH